MLRAHLPPQAQETLHPESWGLSSLRWEGHLNGLCVCVCVHARAHVVYVCVHVESRCSVFLCHYFETGSPTERGGLASPEPQESSCLHFPSAGTDTCCCAQTCLGAENPNSGSYACAGSADCAGSAEGAVSLALHLPWHLSESLLLIAK